VRRAALLAVAAALVPAGAAAAATPEQELATKYAPVVALKHQDAECDSTGEPYRPLPADVVLGQEDVRLVDADGRLLGTAPTAADLFGKGEDVFLDLPGETLDPGCDYEQWQRRIAAGEPTTAYARVVTEAGKPGKLALQYWLYYVFNDWNNRHESDWEMVQLMFDASTAAEALEQAPREVGYSQHSGGERAVWDDSKLERRGTHPVVFPGARSHANYFTQSLWLGHSADEGFGCDDTRGPSDAREAEVVLLPVDAPTSTQAPFAWLGYDGHWGQKEKGPNNGPTGPNRKTQWEKPVTWAQDTWRDSSTAVPLEKTVGTSTTDFFCGAVGFGSKVYMRFLRTPWFVLGVLAGIAALGVWLSRRTRWSPAPATPLDLERSAGEIYRAGWKIYRRYWALLLGIGLVFLPLSALAAIAQELVFDFTGVGHLVELVADDPIAEAIVALAIGQLATGVAAILVTGAVAAALVRAEAGRRPDALDAYRGVWPQAGALAWAWFRVAVVVTLLAITILGIPLAIVYLVRKTVLTQACVLEGLDAAGSLRRSSELVRRHGMRVFLIAALVNVTAYLVGPVVGVLVLFLTSSSLAVLNVISSLVYVVVMPYAGVAIVLLFYDLRRRLATGPAPVTPPLLAAPTASH